ncbi:MAG: hypothetical protein BWK73_19110 [Thiothrix lacustris]|uniref:Uncharacterized protein n=1 Tax=Thiothrix lacustris TaxID=525917 RepID=A0A1Y1QQA2_9GAMM|nr:MAG: hypothetical protein BWK73_19110 [Thiothrix lacustris]
MESHGSHGANAAGKRDGCYDGIIADIAITFHWSHESLMAMRIRDLRKWHNLAIDRAKVIYG